MVKRATIGDVAAAAGVSIATVSRVINGGAVKPSTASRVTEAVTLLEYTPNALTKTIFTGRSSTIGVVIEDQSSPFYLDLMQGIDEIAATNGSLVMFASTFRHIDREAAQVQTMDEHRVRGMIVTTGSSTDAATRRMAENGTPCVLVARRAENPPPNLHSVSLNNQRAGRMMAAHLLAHGRRRIGVVTSGERASQTERVAGLRLGLAEAGLELPDDAIAVAPNRNIVDPALGTVLGRWQERGAPLDAIVCLTGRLTVAVYATLTGQGLGIPDDLAFVTMDDFPWGNALGITVVAQPALEMGQRAATLIVEKPDRSVQLVFEPTLVARSSCGEADGPHRGARSAVVIPVEPVRTSEYGAGRQHGSGSQRPDG